ncbi:MAG: hypothetical protein ACK4PC_15955, partial [Sphingopyxis sp.]
MTQVEGDGDERGLAFGWNGHASVEWDLPAGGLDVRDFDVLALRAAQGTRHTDTVSLNADAWFGITLRDAAGRSATVRPGWNYKVTKPYQRTGVGGGAGWAN